MAHVNIEQATAAIAELEDGNIMKTFGQILLDVKKGQDSIGTRLTGVENSMSRLQIETQQNIQTAKTEIESEIDNRTLNDFWSRQEEYDARCQITFVDEPRDTSNGKRGNESNNKEIAIKRVREMVGDQEQQEAIGYKESWVTHVVRYKQTFRTTRKDARGSDFDCIKVFFVSDHAANSVVNAGRKRRIDGFRQGQTIVQSKMFKMSKQVTEEMNNNPQHNGVWKVRNYRPTFVGYKEGVTGDQRKYMRPPSNFVPDPYYFMNGLRKGPNAQIKARLPIMPETQNASTSFAPSSTSASFAPTMASNALAPMTTFVQTSTTNGVPQGQHLYQVQHLPQQQGPFLSQPIVTQQVAPQPGVHQPVVHQPGMIPPGTMTAAEMAAQQHNNRIIQGAHSGAFFTGSNQYSNYNNTITSRTFVNSSFLSPAPSLIPPTPDPVRPKKGEFNRSVIPFQSTLAGISDSNPNNKDSDKSKEDATKSKTKRNRTPGSSNKKISKRGKKDGEDYSLNDETDSDMPEMSAQEEESEGELDTESQELAVQAATQLFQDHARYNSVKKRMTLLQLGEGSATHHAEAIRGEIMNKIEESAKIHGSTKPRQLQRNIRLGEEITDDTAILTFLEKGHRTISPDSVLPPLTMEVLNKITLLQAEDKLTHVQSLKEKCVEVYNERMNPPRYQMFVSTFNQSLARAYGKGAPKH